MKKQLISISVMTGLIVSLSPEAYGQLTYQGATVYRVGTTELIFSGTTGTKIPVDLGPIPVNEIN